MWPPKAHTRLQEHTEIEQWEQKEQQQQHPLNKRPDASLKATQTRYMESCFETSSEVTVGAEEVRAGGSGHDHREGKQEAGETRAG